jgi:hypothetical protein
MEFRESLLVTSRRAVACLVFALALLLPGVVSAAKVYRWVDKDGKITYQETPPPAGAGKVEEKNINHDQNVITAPPRQPVVSGSSGGQPPDASTGSRANRHRPHPGVMEEEGVSGQGQEANPPSGDQANGEVPVPPVQPVSPLTPTPPAPLPVLPALPVPPPPPPTPPLPQPPIMPSPPSGGAR